MSGIYLISNSKNGKVYVGSSKNIEKRKKQHFKDLESNAHHSAKLQRSYNAAKDKSVFQFSVIEEVNDLAKLVEREQYYIELYRAYTDGYNCSKLAERPCNTVKSDALKKAYQEFYDLYDPHCMQIMPFLLRKIEERSYKQPMIKKIVAIIKWFSEIRGVSHMLQIQYEGNRLSAWITGEDGSPLFEYVEGVLLMHCDTRNLLNYHYIEVDDRGVVLWLDNEYPDERGAFSKTKRACKSGRVRLVDGCLVII